MKRNTIFGICLLMLSQLIIFSIVNGVFYLKSFRSYNHFTAIVFLYIIFTFLDLVYIYYHIIKPTKKLNNQINQISKGNYNKIKNISGSSELVNLANSINILIDSMNSSINKEKEYANQMNQYIDKLKHAYDIIEKSSIVVLEWSFDPDIPAIYVTENISMFGYCPEDFYSKRINFWDLVYEPDREKAMNVVSKARISDITEFKHSYRIICKDGTTKWVEEWTFIERDVDGNPISEKGILHDITSQVIMAEKLKQSEERYRGLFENASAIILTYDLDGNLTSVNNAMVKASGYTTEELLRMNTKDFLEPAVYNKIKEMNFIEYISNNPDKLEELKVRVKNNQYIVVECKSSIVYKNGLPFEIQTISQDITERKAAEKEIYHLSYHDKLTGVYNRAYYEMFLKEVEQQKKYPLSIIVGDINSLKLTNDAFGHKEGDNLLEFMSNIIQSVCRQGDIVARVGGDEFAVVLPCTSQEGAAKVCSRIRKLCDETAYGTIKPSIALGYATKISENQKLDDILKEADENMYKNKLNESRSSRSSLIASLQTTLEEKTMETKEHAERLRQNSLKLGKALNFSDSMMDELSIASIMHDIGKIGIPDDILLKPGKLNDKEWNTMRKHTEIGYHIILSSPNLASIAEYILAHHERWDGKGYPRGISGSEIPIISRVISIADSFDVMTNDRPYCKAKSREEAFEELRRCAGTQFDPGMVDIFIDVVQ